MVRKRKCDRDAPYEYEGIGSFSGLLTGTRAPPASRRRPAWRTRRVKANAIVAGERSSGRVTTACCDVDTRKGPPPQLATCLASKTREDGKERGRNSSRPTSHSARHSHLRVVAVQGETASRPTNSALPAHAKTSHQHAGGRSWPGGWKARASRKAHARRQPKKKNPPLHLHQLAALIGSHINADSE